MRTTTPKVHLTGNQRGQATIMVTLGTVFIFGLLGLVVDVGYGYYIRQVAQAAADSAVLAGIAFARDNGSTCGSGGVLCSTAVCSASPSNPPSTNFDAACLYAKSNGFPSTGNQSVTLSAGSGSAANTGVSSTYWMTATATQNLPLSFLRVMGFNTGTVTAQATGAMTGNTGGGCIYVLDPNAAGAYTQTGNTTVQSTCGIYDNSSDDKAFVVKGGGVINSTAVNVVGGTMLNNNTTVNPTPTTGVSSVSDPFANLPTPPVGGCDYSNVSFSSGTVVTLSPGTYCNGIKASGNAQITFNPGTYVLNGGGMQISSSYITLNGTGVTFYNTASGYSFGPITIVGNATVNLTAPTSGDYRGILMYQDRSIVGSASSAIGGGSTENFTGTVYLPTATLAFAGGSSTTALTMALVVDQLSIVGNTYLSKDTSSGGNATGLSQPQISLVR